MFSVEQVLKFHRDNYDPNWNKEGPPIYLPYMKPRSVCVSFNPTRISQTIQRAANDTPYIDSNQFIFYGLGEINTIPEKPLGYYAAKSLPYINQLPVFNEKVFPLHTLPKVFVLESDVRPSTFCFVTPIYSIISKSPSGIKDPDFSSSASHSVSGSIVWCLFGRFAFFGGMLPYLPSWCSTFEWSMSFFDFRSYSICHLLGHQISLDHDIRSPFLNDTVVGSCCWASFPLPS